MAKRTKKPASAAAPSKRRSWFWWVKWSVRLAGLSLVAVMMILKCDGLFYLPDSDVVRTPDELSLEFEEVWFETSDGLRLSGWFLPARGKPKGTVVHFHGNAANVSRHIELVEWLPGAKYNVLMFDYRGYGKSQGKVTREGTILDGHAAIDYALSRSDVDPKRLFAFGQSIGGAVAIVVAAERPEVRGVVVDSTFSGYRRVGARILADRIRVEFLAKIVAYLFLSGDYDPVEYVARLAPRPLLVIASGRDQICDPTLSEELYDAASEPKDLWRVAKARHMEAVFLEPEEARKRITGLFEKVVASGR